MYNSIIAGWEKSHFYNHPPLLLKIKIMYLTAMFGCLYRAIDTSMIEAFFWQKGIATFQKGNFGSKQIILM